MRIDIITIFPGYFAPLGMSLIGKAALRGDVQITVHDLRDWSHDAHRTVDDTPYGGGPGMVMKPEPWGEALDAVTAADGPPPRLVVPAPSGALFTQQTAAGYAREPRLVFACGRYEGIDARVVDEARTRMAVDEVSIGDYVLAAGPVTLAWRRPPTTPAGRKRRRLPVALGAPPRMAAGAAWRACSRARCTPSPASGAAVRSRRFCCLGITAPSPGGGGMPRCRGPPPCAPN